MGKKGGRGRNTAKTGDKALNRNKRARESFSESHDDMKNRHKEDGDDDAMYDRVDRFHNQRQQKDYLRLDDSAQNDEESEDDVQVVMDLGVGASDDDESSSSSSSSSNGSDDDADDVDGGAGQMMDKSSPLMENSDDEEDEDDEDDEEEEEEPEDVRDWGKRKSSYYHGDTTDLEIGQDQDDAFLEEQAAKEIQKARMQDLTEEDFMLDKDDDEKMASSKLIVERNVQKLSRREKKKLLDQQSPEFLPLVTHFTEVVRELNDRTLVATSALLEGEVGAAQAVGATPLGCEYLVTKAMIETASALNLAAYLLLKREQQQQTQSQFQDSTSMSSHPVMSRLQKLHNLSSQLETVTQQVPGLSDQLDKLVQAASLMKNGEGVQQQETTNASDSDQDGSGPRGRGESVESEDESSGDDEDQSPSAKERTPGAALSSSSSSDGESVNEDQRRLQVLHEARFALRPKELEEDEVAASSRKRRPALDFGEDAPEGNGCGKKKMFAATLNSIQQRSTKQAKKSVMAEDLDDCLDRDSAFLADEEEEDFPVRTQTRGRGGDSNGDDEGVSDPELEDDEGGDFYSQVARKSHSRKAARKDRYQVAPKYPRVEQEIDGERAASKKILKNRGLVPHKNRLNRNPRVKKREQYRKALIRRKGAVREVRKDEGHRYGGEETGIKSGLSRSRKLV